MNNCIFCEIEKDKDQTVVFSNEYCLFLQKPQEVLIGSGVIVPRKHKETVFHLSKEEWIATYELLEKIKTYLDKKYRPDGYSVGWNVGKVGGQDIPHAHLHVIPRYKDENHAGKGIRFWIKQSDNKRK